jgi:hypothetical protein
MMMTSVNDIQSKLRDTIGTYKKLKIMDAVLQDGREQHKNQTLSDSSDQAAYGYTATKLDAITQQKKVQFQALQSVLEEIKKDGVVKIETLKQDANLTKVERTDGNDDGAAALDKSKAAVVRDFGLGDLITATDITKTQKKQLAEAYLAEIKALDEIKNDSANPTFTNKAPVSAGPEAVLKEYGKLKQAYIEAVKKGLKDKTIELTDNDLDKTEYFNDEPNKKFDPNYKTYTGDIKNGIPQAENVRKTEELAEMKAKLDDIRNRFKVVGIHNVDELLQVDKFEPLVYQAGTGSTYGKGNTYGDGTPLSKLTPEQKSQIVGSSQTAPTENWKPIAKKVQGILEDQKKSNGGSVTTGITLDNFTTKILGDSTFSTNLEKVYTQSSAKPLPEILKPPPIEKSTNKTEAADVADRETALEKIEPILISTNKTEAADVADRETALEKIEPILISTNKDRGESPGGEIIVNKNKVTVMFPKDQHPMRADDGSGLLKSTFRDQPAVFSKGLDGRVYMQFYDRPNVENGTGYVLSTGMVEVDPKLAFEADGKTPKPEIEVSMLKEDTKGRKVIDYYIRGFTKDGTTNGKVYYVARNFSDNIDRLPAIKRAKSWATVDADPVHYKSGDQLAKEEAAKKADEEAKKNPITSLSSAKPAQAVVNPASTQVVQVNRSSA